MTARVYLVGAGPGHEGYLTLRGAALLRRADLVLYDRLASPALLSHAPPGAERVCVEDLPAAHPDRYPLINDAMIRAARAGKTVVRLKGGDPSIFGRVGEEAEALRAAGVPYEIVPGVTAALGAAACAAIPLTHRRHSSAVAFVTGHEEPGRAGSRLDWPALAAFPGTLVFYMGVGRLAALVAGLVDAGKSPDTPVAVVERATTPRQRVVTTTLAGVVNAVKANAVSAPSLVVVGEVVALREQLAWFESRPLFGKTVVLTRPAHQVAPLAERITELGGRPLILPTVEIVELPDSSAVDDAHARIASFGWLVFTSVNGVKAFFSRLLAGGRDLRAVGHLKLAAIGPATAEALREYHLVADVVPETFNSEGLVETLRDRVRGGRVLLARADRGLELLKDELGKVAEVEQVAVYSQRDAALSPGDEAIRAMTAGEVDFVTLTSSNIARVFLDALNDAALSHVRSGRTRLVCISPRTAAEVKARGLPVAAEAAEYTIDGVVAAMVGGRDLTPEETSPPPPPLRSGEGEPKP